MYSIFKIFVYSLRLIKHFYERVPLLALNPVSYIFCHKLTRQNKICVDFV